MAEEEGRRCWEEEAAEEEGRCCWEEEERPENSGAAEAVRSTQGPWAAAEGVQLENRCLEEEEEEGRVHDSVSEEAASSQNRRTAVARRTCGRWHRARRASCPAGEAEVARREKRAACGPALGCWRTCRHRATGEGRSTWGAAGTVASVGWRLWLAALACCWSAWELEAVAGLLLLVLLLRPVLSSLILQGFHPVVVEAAVLSRHRWSKAAAAGCRSCCYGCWPAPLARSRQ